MPGYNSYSQYTPYKAPGGYMPRTPAKRRRQGYSTYAGSVAKKLKFTARRRRPWVRTSLPTSVSDSYRNLNLLSSASCVVTTKQSFIDIPTTAPQEGLFTLTINTNIFSAGVSAENNAQVDGYTKLYDQFMVQKVVMEFWLHNSEEFGTNQTIVQLYDTYDPDCQGGKMVSSEIMKVAGHRHSLLMPGVIYKRQLYPKWSYKDTGNVYSWDNNFWRDASDITKDDRADNGIVMAFTGANETNAVAYRLRVFLKFRHRRQGSNYYTPV